MEVLLANHYGFLRPSLTRGVARGFRIIQSIYLLLLAQLSASPAELSAINRLISCFVDISHDFGFRLHSKATLQNFKNAYKKGQLNRI